MIILSGGFAETGNKGIVLEEEIRRLSRENNIRIIGPNCIGVLDNYSNFSTFFLPWSKVKRPSKGHLSILSQSGSYASFYAGYVSSRRYWGIKICKLWKPC